MDSLWLLLVAWFVLGTVAYGTTIGYFVGEYGEIAKADSDLYLTAVFQFLAGPVGFVCTMILSGFWKHGLRWRVR